MSYQFTAEDSIQEVADVLAPIFSYYGWRWATSEGKMAVPGREKIEEKVRDMVERMQEADCDIRATRGGRLIVSRRREHGPGRVEWTYTIALKISSFPQPEPDREDL